MPSDTIRLSYSKLEQFDRCPRSYYLQHILGLGGRDNFYSAYGSLVHDILRQQIEGAITPVQAKEQFASRYEAEVTPLVTDEEMSALYWLQGYDVFTNQFPVPLWGGKVCEVEKKRVLSMFGVNFSSIIDVLFYDAAGRLVLMDHKSATRKAFYGQNGKKKLRQLYIYSEVVMREYGVFPDVLMFNLFREGKTVEYPFSQEEYEETMEWAQETVDDIRSLMERAPQDESAWPSCPSPRFFCDTLCDVSDDCADHIFSEV